MLVLKTTSPKLSPSAPKPRPVNTVPSSRASFATISAIDSPCSGGRRRARNSFYHSERPRRRPREKGRAVVVARREGRKGRARCKLRKRSSPSRGVQVPESWTAGTGLLRVGDYFIRLN